MRAGPTILGVLFGLMLRNDLLAGGARGANTLKGGSGNDTIDARNGRRDTIDCGAGKRDKVKADRKDRVKHCERRTRR